MAAPAGKRILEGTAWLLGGLPAIPVVCYGNQADWMDPRERGRLAFKY